MTCEVSRSENAATSIQPQDYQYGIERQVEQTIFMTRIPEAALASILSSWIYFLYRFKCLLDAQADGLSGTPLKVAWLSFAIQLGYTIPIGTTHLLAISTLDKERKQPRLRLIGDTCPAVDVFITYCGEGLDVLLDTVRAAAALDYPKDRLRVIVLDDSDSSSVKTAVRAIQDSSKNVFCTTRGLKPKTHNKAGNLNHGLKYVCNLSGGPSDVVAVLDVDMIPSQHWLRTLVPHIVADPGTALANPPQRHYNIPDGDPLGQCMDHLFDVIEPSKNATSSAWCCGTGFVVRRNALDSIGGFPEDSMSEDVLTSFYLAAAGWHIVYVQEDVQWGLVPGTITAQLKQAKRWCAGIISAGAAFRNPRAQKMALGEKYGALFPAIAMAMLIAFNMAIIVCLPFLLCSGAPLVAYSSEPQLRAISLLFLIRFFAILSHDLLATKAANFHLGLLLNAGTWTIPGQFMTMVQYAISTFSGRGIPYFTPSGLADIPTPKSFATRIKMALWNDDFIIHALIIMSLVGGIIASAKEVIQVEKDGAFWRGLLVRAGWPPIFQIWSAYLIDFWIPIIYMLFPPTALSRESLLDRDPITQVAYPNRYAKDQVRVRPSQISAILRIMYIIGACTTAIIPS